MTVNETGLPLQTGDKTHKVCSRGMQPRTTSQNSTLQPYRVVMTSVVWYSNGVLVTDCVGRRKTITAVYYAGLIQKLL